MMPRHDWQPIDLRACGRCAQAFRHAEAACCVRCRVELLQIVGCACCARYRFVAGDPSAVPTVDVLRGARS